MFLCSSSHSKIPSWLPSEVALSVQCVGQVESDVEVGRLWS